MPHNVVFQATHGVGAKSEQLAADIDQTVAFAPPLGRVGPQRMDSTSPRSDRPGSLNRRWLSRVARIGAAVLLCAVSAAFMYDRFFEISSSKAALSGVPMILRAPIDGIVTTNYALPGEVLAADETFAHILNDRIDDSRLTEIAATISSTKGEITALKSRLQVVEAEERNASANADQFREARIQQLVAQIEENDAGLRAAQAKLVEAESAHRRSETLLGSGDTSRALTEQVRRAHAVAESELAAAIDRRSQLEVELSGARAGVFVSGNSNDRSIAQQDQARMRLVHKELSVQLAERESHLASLQTEFDSEQNQFSKRRSAQLQLPTRARLIELRTRSGEYVKQGQEIASFADCSLPTVTTDVDERVFRSLRLGMRAVFSPVGSKAPREGWVIQLVSPLLYSNGSPVNQQGPYRAIVRLQVDKAAEACDIGLAGRIKFL